MNDRFKTLAAGFAEKKRVKTSAAPGPVSTKLRNQELAAKYSTVVAPVLSDAKRDLSNDEISMVFRDGTSLSGLQKTLATFFFSNKGDEYRMEKPRSGKYTIGWDPDGQAVATVGISVGGQAEQSSSVKPKIGLDQDITEEHVMRIVEVAFEDFERACGLVK